MTVDLRLYALVDPEHAGGRDLAELSRLVAQGGATLVQLRDKRSDTRPMVEHARAIKAELAPRPSHLVPRRNPVGVGDVDVIPELSLGVEEQNG